MGGPQDIGFDSSVITIHGLSGPPYSFFRNGLPEATSKNIKYWKSGKHRTPQGISIIRTSGDGDKGWDSTAYSMKLVDETTTFLDQHLAGPRAEDPFFAYIALGAVHTPYSPPNLFFGETRVKGRYPTTHMDMIFEVDLVMGSLMKALSDRGLLSDTLVIFASDNGGYDGAHSLKYGHKTSGPLKGRKGEIWEGS